MRDRWQKVALGTVFKTVTGNTPSKENTGFYGQFMPLVKPPELCNGKIGFASDGLSEAGVKIARIAPPSSVLVSCIGNLAKVALNTIPVAFNQQITAIFPDIHKAIPEFMFYQVLSNSFKEQMEELASGTTIPIVNKAKFNSIQIILPPISEQKRIVAILDEVFEAIDMAVANAEKNLANARELFTSYSDTIFENIAKECPQVPISKVAEVFDGPHATPKTVDSGPVFLGISALQDGQINLGKTRHVTPLDFLQWTRRVKPASGDVVFSYETRLGQAAIIPEGLECCLGRRMGLVRTNRSLLDPRYFVYQYISSSFQRFLTSRFLRGATVDRISLKEFPSFLIRLPHMDQQQIIISRVDSFRTKVERLQLTFTQKVDSYTRMKEVILHRAFSGELTTRFANTVSKGAE